ncbi:MAG: hypothetical protein IPP77_00830 [Bacteroidetes bacterium]|nr:hypothetical protein [Bacteroidota bacterium]
MSKKEFKKETKRIERKIGKSLTSVNQSKEAIEAELLELELGALDPRGPVICFMVKLGFDAKSVAKQLYTSRDVIGCMNGNPNFPSPLPTLADITTAADALELAQNNMRTTPGGKSIRDLRRQELVVLMRRL